MGRISYSTFFSFIFTNCDPTKIALLSWYDLQTEQGWRRGLLVWIRGRGLMSSFLWVRRTSRILRTSRGWILSLDCVHACHIPFLSIWAGIKIIDGGRIMTFPTFWFRLRIGFLLLGRYRGTRVLKVPCVMAISASKGYVLIIQGLSPVEVSNFEDNLIR